MALAVAEDGSFLAEREVAAEGVDARLSVLSIKHLQFEPGYACQRCKRENVPVTFLPLPTLPNEGEAYDEFLARRAAMVERACRNCVDVMRGVPVERASREFSLDRGGVRVAVRIDMPDGCNWNDKRSLGFAADGVTMVLQQLLKRLVLVRE